MQLRIVFTIVLSSTSITATVNNELIPPGHPMSMRRGLLARLICFAVISIAFCWKHVGSCMHHLVILLFTDHLTVLILSLLCKHLIQSLAFG